MNDDQDGTGAPAGTEAGHQPWELPASIEAAWGLRERPHKGPKPGLSLKRIVEAAIRVAEAEGLAGVSMSRVAAELGAATMSLYRYVSAKDELLDLMADAAAGSPPFPPEAGPGGPGWREGLSRWAWTYRAALYRHPWALRIPIRGLPVTPNAVAWFENGLSCLAATGLSENQKASVVLLLSNYVRAEATMGADIGAAIAASGTTPSEWMSYYGRMLATLTGPLRFPAISKLLAAGVFDQPDGPHDEFVFGLDRILDGIDALVRTT